MGVVYLARDTYLDRQVAVKALRGGMAKNEEFRQRFLREARLAAKLQHPHTVIIHDMGVAEDVVFLAMEYVDGGSLEDAVAPGKPLPWREATQAVRDAAEGLAAAHRLDLVHRDVKPANLLRTREGVTKVGDLRKWAISGWPGPRLPRRS
jgi:serine/threonine-protein kinase